jgi:hypothetical protein
LLRRVALGMSCVGGGDIALYSIGMVSSRGDTVCDRQPKLCIRHVIEFLKWVKSAGDLTQLEANM